MATKTTEKKIAAKKQAAKKTSVTTKKKVATVKKKAAPAPEPVEEQGPPTLLDRLINKGNSVKEKGSSSKSGSVGLIGKIILVGIAVTLLVVFALRKRGLAKKRAELIENKNNLLLEVKLQNRDLKDEAFKDKVEDITKEIEQKKQTVEKIKEELRRIETYEKQEQKALSAINSWDTFNKQFS